VSADEDRAGIEQEQTHRDSTARLSLALEAGRLGDWSWVAATDAVTLSDRAAHIFGLPRGEMITWTSLRELLHEEHRETARLAVSSALEARTDYDIEYRVRRPSGGECWVAARGRGTYGDDGTIQGMIGVVQDITARKDADEKLRAQELQLRTIFEHAAVGIATADLSGRFLEVNQRFADILGFTREELTELSFRDTNHPDDLDETNAAVQRLLTGEIQEYRMEKRYVRKDRSIIWVLATVTVTKDASGAPMRFIGVLEDITPRRKTEEALRRSEEFSRTIIESSRDCIKTLSLEGEVLWISDSGCRALEVDGPHAVVGQPWARFWKPDDQAAAAEAVRSAAGGGTGSFVGSFLINDRLRFWDVVLTPIRAYSGEPVMILAVSRDVTEAQHAAEERRQLLESERHARTQAERLSAIKDEFLAVLSHELRTPLSAILGWTHIMRHRAAQKSGEDQASAELQKGLEVIERNARMQTQLIEDLLDMSRISSGKLRLDVRPLEPAQFIDAALEMVRPAAAVKDIKLELVCEPNAGSVTGDAGRLQQVVWNLLSNAIKFTPAGGRVQVLVQRVATNLEISVADSGVGIRADFLEHVFERFRQADASTTRKHGGLGLGLAIVKQLVEVHGGSVRASSDGAGLGATFTVSLPLAGAEPGAGDDLAAQRPPTVPPPPSFKSFDLAGVMVLVVEDDPDTRALVARVLDECGADVYVAARAEDAVIMVERARPHVIVSDISMPDIDGFELLRRLRVLGPERGGNAPVIALTAFAREEDRERTLAAGFASHLTKPIELSGLVATVAALSGRGG